MRELFLDEKTRSQRHPWRWTGRNEARAADILAVMNDVPQKFWPMTARQVYYRLISSNRIKNDHWLWNGKQVDTYGATCRTLKWMRIDGKLPWNAITDEHRILTAKMGYTSPESFIDSEMHYFLDGYSRCLAQKQPNHIEIWTEKAALLHIIKPVADEFCRRVVICRGYNSVTFQADFYRRAIKAMELAQTPIVLYFGDWDPSGVNMIHAAIQTLHDELDLVGVKYYRAGINPEHFSEIPADPVPIKDKDTRSKRFVEQYGPTAYELDALHPERLQELVRKSIEQFTNMEAVIENKEQEEEDEELLSELRDDSLEYIEQRASELGLYEV